MVKTPLLSPYDPTGLCKSIEITHCFLSLPPPIHIITVKSLILAVLISAQKVHKLYSQNGNSDEELRFMYENGQGHLTLFCIVFV